MTVTNLSFSSPLVIREKRENTLFCHVCVIFIKRLCSERRLEQRLDSQRTSH